MMWVRDVYYSARCYYLCTLLLLLLLLEMLMITMMVVMSARCMSTINEGRKARAVGGSAYPVCIFAMKCEGSAAALEL